jgi:hypothetical protein
MSVTLETTEITMMLCDYDDSEGLITVMTVIFLNFMMALILWSA